MEPASQLGFPWLQLKPALLSGTLNFWWCTATLAWFSICTAILVHRVRPLRDSLIRVTDALAATADSRQFAERFETYSEMVRAEPVLHHAWSEFEESLVKPREGEPLELRNAREPQYFFSEEMLVEPVVHGRFFDSVPGQLVGLGILGTFIGLAGGIAIATTSIDPKDPQEIFNALNPLLRGASMAFTTSIVGLFFSLGFLLIDRWLMGRLRRRLARWVDALERRLVLITGEQLAVEHLSESRRQTNQLQRFNDDLVVSLEKALDEAVASKLGPQLEAIVRAVDSLRDDRRDWSLQEMEKLIGQFSEAVTQSAGKELRELASTVEKASDQMKGSLDASVEANRVAQEGLTGAAKAIEEAAVRGGEQLRSDLGQAVQGMTREMGSAAELVSRELKGAAGRIGTATTEMAARIREELGHALETVAARLEAAAAAAAAELTLAAQGLRTAGEAAAGRLSAVAEQLQELIGSVGEVVRVADEQMEKAGEAVDKMRLAAADWVTIHESVRQFLEPALEVVAQIERAAGGLGGNVDRLRELAGEIQAAVAASHTENQRIAGIWESYRERFESVDRALETSFRQLVEGTGHYSEQVRKFVEELDKQSASAIDRMSAGTSQLKESIDELSDALTTARR